MSTHHLDPRGSRSGCRDSLKSQSAEELLVRTAHLDRRGVIKRSSSERLFAWLGTLRRLVVRYERHALNYVGCVLLGCILILLRQH